MSDEKILNRSLKAIYISFIAFYAVNTMTGAVYGTFLPVYLSHIGMDKEKIGVLMSIGPFIAILAQPFWGIRGDRASSKNLILRILLFGSLMSVALYTLSNSFLYLLIIITVYTFFSTSVGPIGDTITLEHLSKVNQKYGPVRMAGSLGYCIMSVIAGVVAQRNISGIFGLYVGISITALLITFLLPTVKGHQTKKDRVSPLLLFKNKNLVIIMLLNVVVQITLGYYYTYFPLYLTQQLKGTNTMLGIATFLSSVSEVPFLLFADRILKKIGTKGALLGATAVAALRWFLIYSVRSAYAFLPLQLLHGLIFIVLYYSIATYINREVPPELKASGQTMNSLLGMGIARIIGSLFGGFLSVRFGIRNMFLYNSIFAFIALIVFGIIFLKTSGTKKPAEEI